jgi:glycosyltransferase involved in cell wall biosynthesis
LAINILQLISSSGFFGAENVVLELSTELNKMGHSVTIGIFNNHHKPNLDLMQQAMNYGLETHVFDCRQRIDLKTIRLISSYVKNNGIDIVHTHEFKSNVYAKLSALVTKKPLLSTCHNWIDSNLKMHFYNSLDKRLLKHVNAVIPVSRPVQELLFTAGISRKKITLIENGINIEKFNTYVDELKLKNELCIDPDQIIIGTVGRLSNEKGHRYLIEAAKKILMVKKNCVFLLIGDGDFKSKLKESARKLNLGDKIIFAGKRLDVPQLLSIMDIFVLPSLLEGQPMALFEAMAAKKPIVATKVGDVSKILRQGICGMLVPPSNADAIAEAVLTLIASTDKAGLMASLAYSEVSEKYSSKQMANKYLDVYKSLCF